MFYFLCYYSFSIQVYLVSDVRYKEKIIRIPEYLFFYCIFLVKAYIILQNLVHIIAVLAGNYNLYKFTSIIISFYDTYNPSFVSI